MVGVTTRILEAEGEVIDNNRELSKIIKKNEDDSILLKVRRGEDYAVSFHPK